MDFAAALDTVLSSPQRHLHRFLTGDPEQLTATMTEAAWRMMISMAFELQLAGVLYSRMKRNGARWTIPDWAMQKLNRGYLAVLGRYVRNREILKEALVKLSERNIPAMLLKGMHLVEWVYESPGMRPMADIDLMFHLSDLGRAQEMIRHGDDNHRLNTFPIDYHWNADLSGNSKVSSEALWAHKEQADLDGIAVYRLCKEHLIITLCTHLALHHHFHSNGVRCLWDIKTVVEKYHGDINWKELLRDARRWQVQKPVVVTLYLVRKLFDLDLPIDGESLWYQLSTAKQVYLLKALFEQKRSAQSLSPFFWRLFRPAPLAQKIRWCRKLFLPEPGFVSQKFDTAYGGLRNYLFYPIRIWAKAQPYLSTALQIMRKDPVLMPEMRTELQDMAIQNWLAGIVEKPKDE